MSDIPEPPAERDEARAIELMRLVGSRTPAVGSRYTTELVARARAQRALAGPLRALGGLAAALVSALAYVARVTREEPRS